MRPATEEEHRRKCTPEMVGWYDALKTFMRGLGDDVAVCPTLQYVGFWRTRTARRTRIFAYVNFRPRDNLLYIDVLRPPHEIPFTPGLRTRVAGSGWRERLLRVDVDSTENVEQAKWLLDQSYQEA
jgi:hypothetical protein